MKKLFKFALNAALLVIIAAMTAFGAPVMADVIYMPENEQQMSLQSQALETYDVRYMIVATPKYSLFYDFEFTQEGYVTISAYDDIEDTLLAYEYYDVPSSYLGIEEGEEDDNFLAVLDLTMTVWDDGVSFDRAENLLVKKTVTDLTLGTVSSNTAQSYYAGTNAKLLSGKITAGSEIMYAFNAPYSYIRPEYPADATALDKYGMRNENNIFMLDFYANVDENGVIRYDSILYEPVSWPDSNESFTDVADRYFTNQATELAELFYQVYTGGLYEAELYDIDGNGIYDFMDYKPYMFFNVDSDEDCHFYDSYNADGSDKTTIPYIFTNGATVLGAEFDDGDFVVGYVDVDEMTVKVAEVIKPTTAKLDKIKASTGSIVLDDDTPVNVGSAWKYAYNLNDMPNLIFEDAFDDYVLEQAEYTGLLDPDMLDKQFTFYIYDGVLLLHVMDRESVKYEENLIIPLDMNGNNPESVYDEELDKDLWYVYAYVDGSCKYVPVETEGVYPQIIEDSELTYKYNGQLCTYTIDEDGIYHIVSLAFAEDENGEYTGIENEKIDILDGEDDTQFIVSNDYCSAFTRVAGTRYSLEDSIFDRNVVLKSDTVIVVASYDSGSEKYVINEYDSTSAKLLNGVELYNLTYVVANNIDSRAREDLVLLFAYTDEELSQSYYTVSYDNNCGDGTGVPVDNVKLHGNDFVISTLVPIRDGYIFKGWATSAQGDAEYAPGDTYTLDADVTFYAVWEAEVISDYEAFMGEYLNYRIVSNSTVAIDEYGNYRHYYELFNPMTGSKEQNVASNVSAARAAGLSSEIPTGAIVKISDGMVDEAGYVWDLESRDYLGRIDTSDFTRGLVWLTDLDTDENTLGVVPMEISEGVCCTYGNEEAVANYSFDTQNPDLNLDGKPYKANPDGSISYEISEHTAIMVLKYSHAGEDTTEWGSSFGADIPFLANANASTKYYYDRYVDLSGNYTTRYAPYLAGYVIADENNVAKIIVVISNPIDESMLGICTRDLDCPEQSLKINYHKQGGSFFITAASFAHGINYFDIPEALPTRDGYKFVGWSTTPEGSVEYQPGVRYYNLKGTLDLYAIWEEIEAPVKNAVVTLSSAKATAGNTVTLSLNLANNPGLAGLSVNIAYDSALSLERVDKGPALSSTTFIPPEDIMKKSFKLLWFTAGNDYTNGCIATLTFKIPQGTPDGKYLISVTTDSEDWRNQDFECVDVSATGGEITVQNIQKGDANGDTRINIQDVILLAQYCAGWESAKNRAVIDACYVNGDAKINIQDVILLAQYCAGWNVTLG